MPEFWECSSRDVRFDFRFDVATVTSNRWSPTRLDIEVQNDIQSVVFFDPSRYDDIHLDIDVQPAVQGTPLEATARAVTAHFWQA